MVDQYLVHSTNWAVRYPQEGWKHLRKQLIQRGTEQNQLIPLMWRDSQSDLHGKIACVADVVTSVSFP